MAHDPNEIRRLQKADARLEALNVAVSDRAAARRVMIRQIEAEEAAAVTARTAKAEAEAERQRIAAVVKAGRDTGRPRQALRLALAGPVTEKQARAILAGLPQDAEAKPEHLALPTPGTYGPPGAVAESKRLSAIFAHPAASERFTAACALALDGDAPPEAVAALLSGLPPEAIAPRPLSIEERAEGLAEFGPDPHAGSSRAERVADTWRAAVRKANASIGAGANPAHAPGAAAMSALPEAAPGGASLAVPGAGHVAPRALR
jgi:hypothetical protein